jgi:hypothetical protein
MPLSTKGRAPNALLCRRLRGRSCRMVGSTSTALPVASLVLTPGTSGVWGRARDQKNETVCADVLGSPSSVHEYVMVAVRDTPLYMSNGTAISPPFATNVNGGTC